MERPSSFYKFLMDLPSHQLQLPQGFAEKYPEIIRRNAKLRIASGATWEVRVEKLEEDDDCYFFTEGWTKFLQQMKLQRFELLVFSYSGNSTFHVTVYAANAFEKASNFCSHNPRFKIHMKEYQRYTIKICKQFCEAAGLRGEEKVVLKYAGGKSVEVAVKTFMSRRHSLMRLGKGWKKFCKKNKMSAGKSYSFEFLPEKKVILVEEVANDEEREEGTWRFIKKLKDYNFSDQRMDVPRMFAKGTGLARRKEVELENEEGGRWKVGITDRNRGMYCFSRGWRDFLVANSLEPDTIVVFEYVRGVVKVVVMDDEEEGEKMLARALHGGFLQFL